MPPTISVITPSLNQAAYVERTIRSVLDQGAPALEYVVVDGGSTDETTSLLRNYERQLGWLSERDDGQAQAINKGFRATSGEIVGFLNSDDLYLPGAVEAAVTFLEAHPEIDVVYGDAYYLDENDRVIEPYPTAPWDLTELLGRCYLCQPAVFFRRRLIEQFGGLDEGLTYCLDYEYWLRLALGGAKFAYLPRLLAGFRLYPRAKSVRARLAAHVEVNDMLRGKLGRVPDRWLLNYGHAYVLWKGISHEHLLRSRMLVFLAASYASLRWNHRFSPYLLQAAGRWFCANAHPLVCGQLGLTPMSSSADCVTPAGRRML